MNPGSCALAEEPHRAVHDPGPGAQPPRVTRVDEAVSATGPGDRLGHERVHVRVAADHAVEGHDVAVAERRRDRHVIAGLVSDPVGSPLPDGLLACDLDECGRPVDVDRAGSTEPEERLVNGADSGSDVENRLAFHAAGAQALDEPAGRPRWTRPSVGLELTPRLALAELVAGRAGAARAARIARTLVAPRAAHVRPGLPAA